MSSNIEQVVVIGLLFVKLGLLTFVARMKFVPKFIRVYLPKKLKKIEILLNELIGIHIFMIVSAAGTIRYFGFV